jgi:hypothetical protein
MCTSLPIAGKKLFNKGIMQHAQALNLVGLGAHFPSEKVMGWSELQEAQFTSKTQCATQVLFRYL